MGTLPELQHWPVTRLIEYARNPRKNDHAVAQVAAAIKEFGFRVPIIAKSDGLIVDGHLRLKAAKLLGMETVPVMLADDMTDTQIKAFRISVNRMAELADWDIELLALEIEDLRLEDFDIDMTGFDAAALEALFDEPESSEGDGDGPNDDTYSRKIEAPIYEPKGENPQVSDLTDATKAQELRAEIDAANLPEDVRGFLRAAADRHTVFHFRRIAEFYAHAGPELQRLMERSALVIIDFDKAIENGFIALTERLGKIADFEEGADHDAG